MPVIELIIHEGGFFLSQPDENKRLSKEDFRKLLTILKNNFHNELDKESFRTPVYVFFASKESLTHVLEEFLGALYFAA